MRKSTALIVSGVVFAMLLFGGVAYAQTYVSGSSPQSAAQPCSLSIPEMVAIQIQDSVRIILTTTGAGDTLWPRYKYPTEPAASPYSYVWYWTNDSTGATVATKGSANWSPGILLGQLYHAPAATAKTSDGTAGPASPWVAFTTEDVKFDSTSAAGEKYANLDYEFMWEATDSAWTGAPVTLTYTVTGR